MKVRFSIRLFQIFPNSFLFSEFFFFLILDIYILFMQHEVQKIQQDVQGATFDTEYAIKYDIYKSVNQHKVMTFDV